MPHPPAYVASMAIASTVTGVLVSLALKWQNRQKMRPCSTCLRPKHFQQAMIQTALMFAGELLCFILYAAYRIRKRHRVRYYQSLHSPKALYAPSSPQPTPSSIDETPSNQNLDPSPVQSPPPAKEASGEIADEYEESLDELIVLDKRCPWYFWIAPAIMDFGETVFCNMATAITYASTVLMLQNSSVVLTAILSLVIMRRPLKVHEWSGTILVTLAMVFASIPALVAPESATNADVQQQWLGIVLSLLGTSAHALQQTWEEKLFEKGKMHSVLAVGIEGATGLIVTMIGMMLVHYFRVENIWHGLYQISTSSQLQIGAVVIMIFSFCHNTTGVVVTKWSSALMRALFLALKSPLLWIAEMGLGWNVFSWYNVLALALLLLGLAVHLRLKGSYPRQCEPLCLHPVHCFCLTTAEYNAEDEDDYDVPAIFSRERNRIFQ